MADKTTTLKTKTNDNVYPNIIGHNMDNAIADSPQIKHTLTAEHKINLRLDTNVNNLINNSLQKPAGLTKTELVGVGTNGQENIEIGDNLTLANGKLSASGGDTPIWLPYDEANGWDLRDAKRAVASGGGVIYANEYESAYISNLIIGITTALPAFAYTFDGVDSLIVLDVDFGQQIKVKGFKTVNLAKRSYSHYITITSPIHGSINFNYYNSDKSIINIDTL